MIPENEGKRYNEFVDYFNGLSDAEYRVRYISYVSLHGLNILQVWADMEINEKRTKKTRSSLHALPASKGKGKGKEV